ncbi:MAG: M28 family peptidase [Candidatus Acidiferrales bacterium]
MLRKCAMVICLIASAILLPHVGFSQKPPANAAAQAPPLLTSAEVAAFDQELSGETAERNLEFITREHRMRGSRGFRAAADFVAEKARSYGLTDVTILSFPADGKTFYGTQKSRLAWDADFAELWEMRGDGAKWTPSVLMASGDARPITLAEDSESADVTADLVDVGEGTHESDYSGKDVRGKIVLVSAQPGAVQEFAVGKHGGVGIVSYAQNQKQAWWGEDENLIRWGHLESFSNVKTFAFMVSLKTGRALRERLANGEQIRLHAVVKAGQHPGELNIVTAIIPGADPKLRDEEIAFSCHLDHQRPGANDNASGCVTILEAARTLQKLISEGKLARPARTLRFIWPPEIEGTTTLLNAKPEFAKRIKAAIHMDMVGGGPATKAIFHVTRGPMSLPSFVYDVAEAFGDFVNRESDQYASTGDALYPFASPEGGKEALQADFADFSMGSDHEVYEEGSFRIPTIYLNDWPDRYIHTNGDVAANIDPTKLKRAAFIGAASGYFLATMTTENTPEILSIVRRSNYRLALKKMSQHPFSKDDDYSTLPKCEFEPDRRVIESIAKFVPLDPSISKNSDLALENCLKPLFDAWLKSMPSGLSAPVSEEELHEIQEMQKPIVFGRSTYPKGPMIVFGYDYLADHLAARNLPRPKLLDYQGMWGSGEQYAYEALNFVDGKRDSNQIEHELSAEYGPVPSELVLEYLKSLESIGVLRRVPSTP